MELSRLSQCMDLKSNHFNKLFGTISNWILSILVYSTHICGWVENVANGRTDGRSDGRADERTGGRTGGRLVGRMTGAVGQAGTGSRQGCGLGAANSSSGSVAGGGRADDQGREWRERRAGASGAIAGSMARVR